MTEKLEPCLASADRFDRYPDYVDSGIEWIGAIPRGWRAIPLKHAVDPTRRITYGIVQCGPDVADGVPYIRPTDMGDESGAPLESLQRTAPEIAAPYSRSIVNEGDLVVSIGPSFGKVMVVPRELAGANLTQGTARVVPAEGVDTRFMFWCLRSRPMHQAWDSNCKGATFRSLTLETLGNCHAAFPEIQEQRAIAEFLNRETGKIDGLVAKKEELIKLLQEKRTTLITRAVTKGLDPHAPMKDSGIEWLGEIPAHWEVCRLKSVATRIQTGTTPPTSEEYYYEDGDVPWYGPSSFSHELELNEAARYLNRLAVEDGSARLFGAGSTMIVTIGATIGKVALSMTAASSNQQITAVSPDPDRVLPAFLAWQLKCSEPNLRGIAPSTTIPILDQKEIACLMIVLPPIDEQQSIIDHVDADSVQIDELCLQIGRAIDRLQELRTALISAAVTGKIDVREEVA